MADQGAPSVEVPLAAVERLLEQQQSHLESLDTKAGVAVGFAGVIAPIGRDVGPLPSKVGVGLAVVAAILAMLSFRPLNRRKGKVHPLGQRCAPSGGQAPLAASA